LAENYINNEAHIAFDKKHKRNFVDEWFDRA